MFSFFKRAKHQASKSAAAESFEGTDKNNNNNNVAIIEERKVNAQPQPAANKIVKKVRFKFVSENKPTTGEEDAESKTRSDLVCCAESSDHQKSVCFAPSAVRNPSSSRLDHRDFYGQQQSSICEDDDGLDNEHCVNERKTRFKGGGALNSLLDKMGGKGKNRHKNKHHHNNNTNSITGNNKKFKNDINQATKKTTSDNFPLTRCENVHFHDDHRGDDDRNDEEQTNNVRVQNIEPASGGGEEGVRLLNATITTTTDRGIENRSEECVHKINQHHTSDEEEQKQQRQDQQTEESYGSQQQFEDGPQKQSTEDAPLESANKLDTISSDDQSDNIAALFVRDLVLQKYTNKRLNLTDDHHHQLASTDVDSFPTVIWNDIERRDSGGGVQEVGANLNLDSEMGQPQSKTNEIATISGDPQRQCSPDQHQQQQQEEDVFYEADEEYSPAESGGFLPSISVSEPADDDFVKIERDDNLMAFKFSGSFNVVDENNNDDSGCDDVSLGKVRSGGGGVVLKHHHLGGKVDDNVSLPDVVESIGMQNNVPITVLEVSERECSEENEMNGHWIDGLVIEEEPDSGFDCDKRDLVNQESRFTEQLTAAEKQTNYAQGKLNDLQIKLDQLERDLTVKVWAIDRLEAELVAANKEGECVRRKLRLQEEELSKIKTRYDESEDLLNRKYQELEEKYNETHQKLLNIQAFTSHLQVQLAEAQSEAESNRLEKEKLINEREEEKKIIQDALDSAIDERSQMEAKWHKEFEHLRNLNQDREEHLMEDCEWKLRSMQKQCKEKIEKAEKMKTEAVTKLDQIVSINQTQEQEIKVLRNSEKELRSLRGLTNEQRENIVHIMQQLDDLKIELSEAHDRAEEEIKNAKRIKFQCQNELIDKERYMQLKIEESKMHISIQWERKLLEEMVRLKCELESVHAEERKESLDKLKEEYTLEINELVKTHNSIENALKEEIDALKQIVSIKKQELLEASEKADKQIIDTRIYIDRSDRSNQLLLDREIRHREELIEQIEKDREKERLDMEEQFMERLQSVKDEFAQELVDTTQELEAKHKRMLGTIPVPQKPLPNPKSMRRRALQQRLPLNFDQISEMQLEQFVAEKEEMLQSAESRHRIKVKDMESRIRELEVEHQRDLQDLERNYSIEKSALEQRDNQNSNEIDTLHRKCRCLTKLFEEMRMRYERREPRTEDVREIAELKEKCESQERDLYRLTEALRNIQIAQEQQQQQPQPIVSMPRQKNRKPNTILNCDVIYEEQEEECDSAVVISEVEDDDSSHELVPFNGTIAIVESP